MSAKLLLVLGALLALLAAPAWAQTFSYPSFPSSAGLQLNGSAAIAGNALRLTAASANQTAGAWNQVAVSVVPGFDSTFSFRITPPAVGTKAEGMAFVIQRAPAGANALGGAVWGIGYGPGSNGAALTNSLAIEIDTFQDLFLGDTSANELTVHTNGTGANNEAESFSIGRTTPAILLSNGLVHTMRVLYVPGNLQVFIDNAATPSLNLPYSFQTGGNFLTGGAVGGLNLADGTAFVGFSATTGAGTLNETVEILSWSFTSTPPWPPCAVGTVEAQASGPIDVLQINGSSGGFARRVIANTYQALTFGMIQPPATAGAAPFILFGFPGTADGSSTTLLPAPIGEICFPLSPLQQPGSAFVLADGFATGLPALLPTTPTPWSFTVPTGLPFPATASFQGIVFDATSAPFQLATTNMVILDVRQGPAPIINSLTPNSAAPGGTITVLGSGFVPGATLDVGGLAITPTSLTATTITFPYPAGIPCGSILRVTNPDQQFATRTINPQPIISNLVPSSGTAAGGQQCVIIGAGFAPGATVTFGGVPATVGNTTNNSIITTTPPGAVGPTTIIVTTPGGCTVSAGYTYN